MTTPAAPAGPGGPRRRRKPPKPVEVVSVSSVTARLVSVLVTGDGLEAFAEAAPTSHIKVFLPADGQDEPNLPEYTPDGAVYAGEGPPPTVRTYTPRRYDPAAGTLEIQFLLHGDGPASEWAARAKPGDKLAVAGPGGRFSLEPPAGYWWLAADESAIPAVATLLEALPETTAADVHIEVDGPDDELELRGPAKAEVTWHYREPGAYGRALAAAARAAVIDDGARVWVACESGAMRDIRRYFTRERGIPLGQLVTRGYWRTGEQNYPDHDYGED
ncbi:MAG TPA: siderophore-interacting protein [Trebonia sp.]|jgi:NADPH-dependent ferric siderophore reductase|nr:siderophore-interacting protein [Trebonia sp.]